MRRRRSWFVSSLSALSAFSAFSAFVCLLGASAPGCGEDEQSPASAASSSASSSSGGAIDCTPVNACQECAAEACPEQKQKCCATPGCNEIIACGRMKNCNGIDCYKKETCQDVIDAVGGPLGDATAAAQPLGACAAKYCAGCPGAEGAGGGGGAGGNGGAGGPGGSGGTGSAGGSGGTGSGGSGGAGGT